MSARARTAHLISAAITLASCSILPPSPDPLASFEWAVRLPALEEYAIYHLDWSPDGENIAMLGYGRGDSVRQDILIYDISSRTVRRLIGKEEEFIAGLVAWSPTGDYLAVEGDFWTDEPFGGVWLIPSDGGTPTFVARASQPSFSPSGDRLVATAGTTTWQLKLVELATGEETVLVEHPYDRSSVGRIYELQWSPVSDTLVFTVQELTSDGLYGIRVPYLLDLADPHPRPLLPREHLSVHGLSWLPDGEALLGLVGPGQGDLRLISVDGTCILRILPDSIGAWGLDVAPEGDRLAILAYGGVYVIDLQQAAEDQGLPYPLGCP